MKNLDQLEIGNAKELVLDPKHPGINDPVYCARRKFFFNTSRAHRLAGSLSSSIDYTDEEEALWGQVLEKLAVAHEKYASRLYLKGKQALHINEKKIPQQSEVNRLLKEMTGFGLIPAEGLLHTSSFFSYIVKHQMPCTQFLRHPAHPEYTPEPDMVHDMVGHVPFFVDHDYVEITNLIAQGVMSAKDEKAVEKWSRVYWFAIEFSLIEEKGEIKVFGAGLLSSFGEMEYAYSSEVTRKPFHIEDVITTDYDNTQMQDLLFVIPSLPFLKKEVQRLLDGQV